MQEIKTLVNIPSWADNFGNATGKIANAIDAYNRVPVIRRACNLRANSISSVPFHFADGAGNELEDWNFPDKQHGIGVDLLRAVSLSLDIAGRAYAVKLANRPGSKVLGLQLLNPFTVTVRLGASGKPEFTQSMQGSGSITWPAEQMVYWKEYNPADDIQPGFSPTEVALTDAAVLRYITQFAKIYFENGAQPLVLLGVDTATKQADIERMENWFKRQATGIANAFRVLATRGEVKPQLLTPPLKDLAMPELTAQARQAIALAFEVPQTMLEDAANFATASEHRISFWRDSIQPRAEYIEDVLNRQALEQIGVRMCFDFDELQVFKSDESVRAVSLKDLTMAGVPLGVAMDILGYELDDDERVLVMMAGAEPKDTADTPSVMPEAMPAPQPAPEKFIPSMEQLREMELWQRFAFRKLKKGDSMVFQFDVKTLPADVADGIRAKVEQAKSENEVKEAFEIDAVTVEPEQDDPVRSLADAINRMVELELA